MNYHRLKPLTRLAISASMTDTLMHCLPERHWITTDQKLMEGNFDFMKLFCMALNPYIGTDESLSGLYSKDVFEAVGNISYSALHRPHVDIEKLYIQVSIPICKQIMKWHPQKSMAEAVHMLKTEKFSVRELLDLYLKEYDVVGMAQFILEIYCDLENLFKA